MQARFDQRHDHSPCTLGLSGGFTVALGFEKSADKNLPTPGSGAGYHPSEYVFPLILMLNGGVRSLEDTQQIRMDEGLREFLPLERICSQDAFGNWLRNTGVNGGLSALERVNRKLPKRGMKYDGIHGYTLDIDATSIDELVESLLTCHCEERSDEAIS